MVEEIYIVLIFMVSLGAVLSVAYILGRKRRAEILGGEEHQRFRKSPSKKQKKIRDILEKKAKTGMGLKTLQSYEYRCSECGGDGTLARTTVKYMYVVSSGADLVTQCSGCFAIKKFPPKVFAIYKE